MRIFTDLEAWRQSRQCLDIQSNLGFVPTMGNLHAGHLSLIQASQQENQATIVSIFINPTQFNQPQDFKSYPRTLDADLHFLKDAKVDYCLLPTEEAIYPNMRYSIQENEKSQELEGECRPGHFKGVMTVVMKLLQLVKPHQVYLGEKDYQQYILIRDMVKAFFMDITVKACPTIREPSGLPYSSRNSLLGPGERSVAEAAAKIFHQECALTKIEQQLLTLDLKLEYITEQEGRKFMAINVGGIRLIDNAAFFQHK